MSRAQTLVLIAALLMILTGAAAIFHAGASNSQPPVAYFTYSPDVPGPQDQIVFNASSSYSPNGWIVQYTWDFGDGNTSTVTDPAITHAFYVDGDYTVQLTVTDNNGYTGVAVAVIPVRCVVFFRVVAFGTTFPLANGGSPLANVTVTAYYYNGSAWVKAPASNKGIEIKYDKMTQPNLANNDAQRYRNPGYTASILRASASNIGFDIHSIMTCKVFFKFELGSYVTYWPNNTTRVYTYEPNHGGVVEVHDYHSGHQAYWEPAASAYVIEAEDIAGAGVSPTEGHPILVGLVNTNPPTPAYCLTVKTAPQGITTISGEGLYIANTNVTLPAPTYVNVSTTARYRFDYWDVDGTSRGSGVNPITVFMSANHTATAHYVMQYAIVFNHTGLSSDATGTIVTANGNPEAYTQLPFTLWVDSGSSVTYSYGSIVTSSTGGKQFRLSGVTGPSSPVTVTGPATIAGNYVIQYQITFAQTGLDSSASGTVVTVNGNAKVYTQIPYALWVDSGSSVTYSYGSVVSSSTTGKQFRVNTATGPSSPIITTGPTMVTGNYIVQYLVTFAQTGLESTASGTIVTVNGSPKIFSVLPYTSWFDAGSSVTYSYSSIVPSSVSGKQFRLNSVTGASSPITVTGPTTITGNYVAQYQVTFAQTGLDSTATGTVVTANSNTKTFGDLSYTLWVDSGGSVTYSYSSIVTSSVSGKQFRLLNVTGPSSPITVTGPTSIIGNYKTQYYLTVTSAYDSPSPSSSWFDSGSSITESVTSPVSGGSGIQYVCKGWTGTGSVPASGSATSVTFTIGAPSSIMWNWKTQYYLTVASPYDSPSPLSGWFDSGSGITESVTSPVSGGIGTQYVCTGWSGSGSVPASGSASSVTFTITAPSSITWNWKTQYQVTFDQTGIGTDFAGAVTSVDSVNYGVSGLPVSFWLDSGSSHSFSFASPLTVGSKQYVWNSTSGLSTLQSGTLTVTASGSVVGNYQVQNQITFDQVGVSSDFSGTVVIIDAVSYSKAQLPVSFSWSIGSTHSFAFQSPLIVGASSKQYVWTSTTGLSSSQSGSVTVTTYGSIIGNYKTQYYLTVTSPYDSPTPLSGWFDSGSGIAESVTSPVSGGSGIQCVCSGWTGTGSVPVSGSASSVTFTIIAPSSIVWNWKTQYCLTVSSPYDSPTPLSGWFDSGSGIAESVTSPVSGGAGTQYACTGWTGTGSVPVSGSGSSVTFTIGAPSTITWNWKTQYQVTFDHSGLDSSASSTVATVNGTPITYGQLPYGIWVGSGDSITYSYNNVSSSTLGKRFILIGVTGLPSPITVTSLMTVTGNYKTQYQVTFSQTGVGSDFAGTVVTVDSNGYAIISVPVSFWWDNGSSHTFSFSSPLAVNASEQYNWVSTSGLTILRSGSLSVTGSGGVTGNYAAEYKYQVRFDQTGVNTDFTGTAVIIDGVNYAPSALPVSFWWNSSLAHTFAYQSPLVVTPNGKQYVWTSTSGLSSAQSGSMTVTTSGNTIGNYKTQYYLSLATSPLGVTSPSGAGWYDAGTNATISTTAFVDIVPGSSRYRFNGWTAADMTEIQDLTRSPTTVSMDQGKTVTASYVVQYNLTFNQVGVGSDFSDTIVMVDGINYTASGLPVSFMWDNGSIHTFSFVSPLSASKQYAWMFTSGLSTSQADSITVSASGNVAGNYAVTYALTITATTGGATNPAVGVHVYPSGSTVQVTALPNTNYQFDHWELDSVNVGAGNPYSVLISTDHTLNAVFKPVPPALSVSIHPLSGMIQIGQPLTFNSIISGGAPPYSYQWYLDGTSFTGATSSSWTWTPQHASLHFVYVKVTDSNGATAQSELATITVTSTPVPVGGYSISFARPSVLMSIVAYVAVAALSAAVLSARKRKRK